jgi:hypothetical protein
MSRKVRLNKSQRRKLALIDELVKISIARGVTPVDLQPHVKKLCGSNKTFGENVSAAGLSSQVSFLLGARNEGWVRKVLANSGSVLDGFVQGYSSDPAQVKSRIGRDKIDENGDVL